MKYKKSEVKETNEEKEPKIVKETIEAKKPKQVKKPKIVKETNEENKTKVKRLAKGLRKHIRRTKSAERKEAIIVNPKN